MEGEISDIASRHQVSPEQARPGPEFAIDPRRLVAQVQSAIADAVDTFGRIDVLLLCRSEGSIFHSPDVDDADGLLSLGWDR